MSLCGTASHYGDVAFAGEEGIICCPFSCPSENVCVEDYDEFVGERKCSPLDDYNTTVDDAIDSGEFVFHCGDAFSKVFLRNWDICCSALFDSESCFNSTPSSLPAPPPPSCITVPSTDPCPSRHNLCGHAPGIGVQKFYDIEPAKICVSISLLYSLYDLCFGS